MRKLGLKVCCILNEKSGTAKSADHTALVEMFAKHGVTVEILETNASTPLAAQAEKAAKNNYDIIVAGGGDGTINAVASALVHHPATRLGILPLGTLNHFARDLGIPFDVEKAVAIICADHTALIDIGAVNDTYFLNNSSVGLYPAMVKLRENLQSAGYSKWWAAALSSLRILSRFRRFDLEIHPANGEALKRKTALLFVGNNAYETAAPKLGTRRSITTGRLWISVPASASRRGLFMTLLTLMLGREKPSDTTIFEATSLNVVSKKKMLAIAADGEVISMKPPLTYRILPKALTVIIPENFDQT